MEPLLTPASATALGVRVSIRHPGWQGVNAANLGLTTSLSQMMKKKAAPMLLCRLDQLPEYGACGFTAGTQEIVVVRQGNQVHAYLNCCPHKRVTLNWLPDQFLDLEGRHIQCATHGALFRIEDGRCVAGPCPGAYLEPISLIRIGDKLYI